MIEECYEVVEAIDRDDTALLREELGDVLLQIVFHSDMEKDAGNFDINDVANDECVKMIHRHPHVFGMVKADTSEQVLANWEMIKTEEKQRTSLSDQLRAIPPMLPALMRAQKVSKKMNADATLSEQEMAACIIEDIDALAQSTDCETQKRYMGQALFRLTSLCRRLGLEAEEALTQATEHMIGSVE
jgi:tetrapyrrole methylase family protein/MazG family protein